MFEIGVLFEVELLPVMGVLLVSKVLIAEAVLLLSRSVVVLG